MANEKILDLIIIGAAAAGTTASIYAARRNLDFIVITKDIGGEVALSGEVGNWPGVIKTTGFELAQEFKKHVESYNVKIEEGWEVKTLKKEGNIHIVSTENSIGEKKEYKTKAIIIASGIHPRHLGITGEEEFIGKGITYCTTCDGPLFKGKNTATIGAGNAALESALMMAGIAEKVYLITKYTDTKKNNGGFPRGENILIDKIKAMKNVEIIYDANTTEVTGDGMVSGIKYTEHSSSVALAKGETKGEEKTLDVQGVMVHIGMIPNSDFVTCGKKNKLGEIEVDLKCATDCSGVFAAGDVTNIPYKQIAIAAGHGVTAALSAIDYINKWEE
ncbi:MAG: FAD-dependent oxidoreductase [Candidatus Magasanikbacteria bacterium]|jgi:NADH-dependent peroxiredoxin subunit F|nr:FAD-dependent oxidoreductase [Candidatus Magasanikbacteria bacterium]MBT4315032.1 FAD-dependent oxidoreductase [Candidatus Magasanikbacteria bacterium]MBT4546811.1 FAD-dependent oxidoreductase [Candidatus Magasanikbacteria bacterium]MBT6818976.1 FAD-dependent oxidoreductase [Candidatus Magasanikbacteria bacterium]